MHIPVIYKMLLFSAEKTRRHPPSFMHNWTYMLSAYAGRPLCNISTLCLFQTPSNIHVSPPLGHLTALAVCRARLIASVTKIPRSLCEWCATVGHYKPQTPPRAEPQDTCSCHSQLQTWSLSSGEPLRDLEKVLMISRCLLCCVRVLVICQ